MPNFRKEKSWSTEGFISKGKERSMKAILDASGKSDWFFEDALCDLLADVTDDIEGNTRKVRATLTLVVEEVE